MRLTASSLLLAATIVSALPTIARAQSAPAMGKDEIASLVKVHVAIAQARDSAQAQFAKSGNKKSEAQKQLQEKLRGDIEQILHHNGMTEADYERKTYLVSTDPDSRKVFDSVLVAVTGQPMPGQVPVAPPNPLMANLPAGPVGVHIGHVVGMFGDTPNGQGLLPTAVAEARIAAQHAALAARQPTNLDYMKLHAGHVIHAIDPTVVTTGPGQGYGLKKAAAGVITHIELAAQTQGASPNVTTHAVHIATAARNTITRADQILTLAKQVQAATSATDAAALVSQIASLTEQLIAGADANGDGRIGWQEGEGGLQQAEEHVMLMLGGK